MLEFLKKHQRKFFIVITVMTVSSFIFLGTFSTLVQPKQEIPDRKVVLNVTGKPIMKRELYALCQMLATSGMDLNASKHAGMPNLFNDGVIEKELLSGGMSLLLAERYFDKLKPDLDARLKKMQHFRFYSHPKVPYINALSVYQKFAPTLVQHMDLLKKQGNECSLETLALMIQLYHDQALLPSEMLRRILIFQQQQQGIPADPYLSQSDLSLFGFSSLEDWFGPLFIELNAQFIANAAALAEQRGYEVKKDEIRADLYHNIYSGYKRLVADENACSSQDMQQYFHRKMQQFGLDEKALLDAWRKTMLFRRLFADVGSSVLVDSLFYQQFQQYSEQCAKIELYELPEALHFNDFQSMLKFQIYLESIALHPQRAQKESMLPRELCSIEQIEKRCPEIVERACEVEYAEVLKSMLCSEIGLKETWEWECVDGNWQRLQKQFSELSTSQAVNRQERLNALDALDNKRRVAIDAYARQLMIDAMPHKIDEALAQAPMHKEKVSLRIEGGKLAFIGVDRTALIAHLKNAPLSEEGAPLVNADDPLFRVTGDNEHFYRIKVLSREETPYIMRFSECLADGTLDGLLNRRLEASYADARKKSPTYFQGDKGAWKPLKEVKDAVGRYVFSDVLKGIEETYKTYLGALPGTAGELPFIFYSNYRLLSHMEEAKRCLQSNPNDSAWIKNGENTSLADQWLLNKTDRMVARSDSIALPKEEMFHMQLEQWSATQLGMKGGLAFYKVVEQAAGTDVSSEQVNEGHEILVQDARKQLMQELIVLIDQKQAIDIKRAYEESSQ